jgi:hypothetical protein
MDITTEFPAPIPHRFIGQDDAAFGHQLFNVTVAEAKAKVEPDTMTDDLGRKPMTLVSVGWHGGFHRVSMPHRAQPVYRLLNKLTTPL